MVVLVIDIINLRLFYHLQKPNVPMETDKIHTASNVKSPTGSTKKRKRRSIAGLAKVSGSSCLFVKQSSGFLQMYISI